MKNATKEHLGLVDLCQEWKRLHDYINNSQLTEQEIDCLSGQEAEIENRIFACHPTCLNEIVIQAEVLQYSLSGFLPQAEHLTCLSNILEAARAGFPG